MLVLPEMVGLSRRLAERLCQRMALAVPYRAPVELEKVAATVVLRVWSAVPLMLAVSAERSR